MEESRQSDPNLWRIYSKFFLFKNKVSNDRMSWKLEADIYEIMKY